MASRHSSPRHRFGAWAVVGACLAAGLLAGSGGCSCLHPLTRLQKEDEAGREKEPEVRTVGDVTQVANAAPAVVSGVGLVTGLDGTGGGTPPGQYRAFLENELKKRGVQHVKEVLDSEDNALVLVNALIPAGAHLGDRLDVEVQLPPDSKASSLRGGVLQESSLYDFEAKKNLSPNAQGSNGWLKGHRLAVAQGPLLVGFGEGDDTARQKVGRIWGGARTLIPRPYYLTLNNDQQFARISNAISERINHTFREDSRKRLAVLGAVTDRVGDRFSKSEAGGPTARALGREAVWVKVPWEYHLNQGRYLRVARLIPLQDSAEVHTRYRQSQARKLLDPAQTITAALRLEALGEESVPALKAGLKSSHALVRFCSAEALAYLSCPAGVEELAEMTRHQPRLRSYCLAALAGLNEGVCQVKLGELLGSPTAEIRYGAFRALFEMDEHDRQLNGELLNETYWLHHVAPQSPPLAHWSSGHRAEIVLFGEDPAFQPPFYLAAGPEFNVTAGPNDDKCTVSRFPMHRGSVQRKQCSLKLEDVLRTMADLGGDYPDAVELLVQADRSHCLNCPVRADAMPRPTPVEELAKAAKDADAFAPAEEVVESNPVPADAPPAANDHPGPVAAQAGPSEDSGPPAAGGARR